MCVDIYIYIYILSKIFKRFEGSRFECAAGIINYGGSKVERVVGIIIFEVRRSNACFAFKLISWEFEGRMLLSPSRNLCIKGVLNSLVKLATWCALYWDTGKVWYERWGGAGPEKSGGRGA